MRHKLEMIAERPQRPPLSAVQAADLEDELSDWMDDHDVSGGWELAPVFVAGGLRVGDLEAVREATRGTSLEGACAG
ncbi:MAG TPA: hypothetical protein VE709_05510 [Pseudonocardiaceae bacterium]|jgi:hypothetical protein|nr:hypothetical protein [Pseudonocardiaceae bacterium]